MNGILSVSLPKFVICCCDLMWIEFVRLFWCKWHVSHADCVLKSNVVISYSNFSQHSPKHLCTYYWLILKSEFLKSNAPKISKISLPSSKHLRNVATRVPYPHKSKYHPPSTSLSHTAPQTSVARHSKSSSLNSWWSVTHWYHAVLSHHIPVRFEIAMSSVAIEFGISEIYFEQTPSGILTASSSLQS